MFLTQDRDITVNGISTEQFSNRNRYGYRGASNRTENNILSEKAKWINLPLLRSTENKSLRYGRLIAKRYNLIYLGGYTQNKHSKSIYLLNWSMKEQLKWKKLPNELKTARCKPSGCLIYEKVSNIYKDMIGSEKIAIIGGYNRKNERTLKSVELLSFEDGVKTMNLASMKYGRSECGICTTNDTRKRIIVGGGDKYKRDAGSSEFTTKSVEMYDINKDKWMMINNFTRYTHRYRPTIWVLPNDPDIVYIAGDFRGSDMGVIEYCDLRDNQCTWHRHGDTDLCKIMDVMRFKQPSYSAYSCSPIQVAF